MRQKNEQTTFGSPFFRGNARLVPNMELMEMICNENNRDLTHLPGKK